jgi:hypothetical protein
MLDQGGLRHSIHVSSLVEQRPVENNTTAGELFPQFDRWCLSEIVAISVL